MSFTFQPLSIPDVVLVRPIRHGDSRGFFSETYRRSAFSEAGIDATFVQDNLARSGAGVLRGLHYQLPPKAQGKLIQAIRGSLFDVAVDLRRDSRSYGGWVGCDLSERRGEMLWIPPGFAHGYLALGDGAYVSYKVTAEYDAALDRGIRWNDPSLGIAWPLTVPVLSDKDRVLPLLEELSERIEW
jgi:dTDP-4-dehydrorhamnose 3,5-epimerase